jgi:hypothetical protein
VLCFLTLPALVLFGLVAWVVQAESSRLVLLLPGVIVLPLYAMIPCRGGKGVPFSLPTEQAKSAGRGLRMVGVMVTSMALSGLALWAWATGWFVWLLLGETVGVAAIYWSMRTSLASARWEPMD